MTYKFEKDSKNINKIREMKKGLPAFVDDFDVSMSIDNKSTQTRLSYMYDLVSFFEYLVTTPAFKGREIDSITLSEIEGLNRRDIERYLASFQISKRDTKSEKVNGGESLIPRKLSTLRSMCGYFCTVGEMRVNPAAMVPMPKIKRKNVVALDQEDVSKIIRCIETGQGLTDRQQKFAEKTRLRDKAIFYTLIGTGIRISECVGLDVLDVDIYNASLNIVRKGGDEDTVFFSDEVEEALLDYIDNERPTLKPETDALFVSTSHGRLTDRAIENLIGKYVKAAKIPKSHIKVHTLRASYATNLYNETGDVYMVKDALHHASLNTSKHYISGEEDRKRKAAKVSKSLFKG